MNCRSQNKTKSFKFAFKFGPEQKSQHKQAMEEASLEDKKLYFKLTFPRSKFSCVWITGSGSRGSARRVQADTRTSNNAPDVLHMLQPFWVHLQMATDNNSREKLGFSSNLCLLWLSFNFGLQNLKLNGGKSIHWKRNVTFSYSYVYYLVSPSSRSRTMPPIGRMRKNIQINSTLFIQHRLHILLHFWDFKL